MPGEYEILRALLSDRPIAFHPQMARLFGGINEALLFQQIAYWSDKGSDPEWIYKTQKDIEDEITLTRTQQENARRRLRGLGVIEEQKRGVPAKLYYRVVWDAVFALLEEHASQSAGNQQPSPQAPSKDAGNLQPRMLETDNQARGEDADQPGVRTRSITESTQREQTERPLEFRKVNPQDYDESREWLLPYVEDFAREFRDESPLSSTLTRVVKIYRQSKLSEDDFIELLYQSRQITKERTGSVRGEGGNKNLVRYWLAVLERLARDVA